MYAAGILLGLASAAFGLIAVRLGIGAIAGSVTAIKTGTVPEMVEWRKQFKAYGEGWVKLLLWSAIIKGFVCGGSCAFCGALLVVIGVAAMLGLVLLE
jgi:hypothetical protein